MAFDLITESERVNESDSDTCLDLVTAIESVIARLSDRDMVAVLRVVMLSVIARLSDSKTFLDFVTAIESVIGSVSRADLVAA